MRNRTIDFVRTSVGNREFARLWLELSEKGNPMQRMIGILKGISDDLDGITASQVRKAVIKDKQALLGKED